MRNYFIITSISILGMLVVTPLASAAIPAGSIQIKVIRIIAANGSGNLSNSSGGSPAVGVFCIGGSLLPGTGGTFLKPTPVNGNSFGTLIVKDGNVRMFNVPANVPCLSVGYSFVSSKNGCWGNGLVGYKNTSNHYSNCGIHLSNEYNDSNQSVTIKVGPAST